MPIVQIPMKIASSFGFTAFLSIIIDGSDKVVTPIINERTTPSNAPLASRASAIGIVPKISAYIGTPAIVAMTTPKGLLLPKTVTIKSCGIHEGSLSNVGWKKKRLNFGMFLKTYSFNETKLNQANISKTVHLFCSLHVYHVHCEADGFVVEKMVALSATFSIM